MFERSNGLGLLTAETGTGSADSDGIAIETRLTNRLARRAAECPAPDFSPDADSEVRVAYGYL